VSVLTKKNDEANGMRVTPETKIATRKRILDVAQEQFAERGYDVTTTRDIARAAGIAVGTLFNYFPTKEAIVESLVREAHAAAAEKFAKSVDPAATRTLAEELFSHVALITRQLSPYRKYLPAVLETSLSPLADEGASSSLRVAHLETVVQIAARHGLHDSLSAVALQMYWTLFTGALAFWAGDRSPRQEDTLALLDQSLAMFVGWLSSQDKQNSDNNKGG
jgi:AcrR family transcriptional regulator